ncbi:hypothetical protein DUI87_31173 [Hirundo rustica rustica]|uniref:ATP-grasp domain-containing protein n=1 Tax=Hirundo rustica rustica TaxID=333673 RepID=A0A3M0J071_HIRRU|nr:hypothetical protein DUI87_31173 [Hirundo rustica rustica]
MAERVLVIGSGGREHALAWKLAQSPHVKHVFVAPGNAGTADNGKISNSAVLVSNHTIVTQFCKDHNIGLVIAGPEALLAAGIVDDLRAAGVGCFGPCARAAQLASHSSSSKAFLDRHGIPTARWKAFSNPQEACRFITSTDFPARVVRARGPAARKEVTIAASKEEACRAVQEIMQDRMFGDMVVIEELLQGEELSVPEALLEQIRGAILQHVVDSLRQEGAAYVGVLQTGLMLTKEGVKILNFKCQFGDPQCQVILPLLKNDFYEVIQATMDGKLCSCMPAWSENRSAVCVVMASPGYPGDSDKGMEVTEVELLERAQRRQQEEQRDGAALLGAKAGRAGIVQPGQEKLWAELRVALQGLKEPQESWRETIPKGCRDRAQGMASNWKMTGLLQAEQLGLQVFHGGTALRDGRVVTSGGRVLSVTAVRQDLMEAMGEANRGVATIHFQGATFRRDIGHRGLRLLQQPLALVYKDRQVGAGTRDLWSHLPQTAARKGARAGGRSEGGGFAAFFDLKASGYDDPILVTQTKSLGPKLQLAQVCKRHDTIGQDLVALCVNDLLAQGAEPLFFLSHLACGKLDAEVLETIKEGIAEACRSAGCAFLGDVLLTPGKMFSPALLPVLRSGHVKGFAPTAEGLLGGISRLLPEHVSAVLDALSWKIPEIFCWLYKEGNLSAEEMAQTFPCGIGAVLVVQKELAQHVLQDIQRQQEAWLIGKVVAPCHTGSHIEVENLAEALQLSSPQQLLNDSTAQSQPKKRKVIDHKLYGSRSEFDSTIDRVLEEFSVELICLSGFMRVLSSPFSENGKEEPSAAAAIRREPLPGDSEAALEERLQEAELRAFPTALQLVASGAVWLGAHGRTCWRRESQRLSPQEEHGHEASSAEPQDHEGLWGGP